MSGKPYVESRSRSKAYDPDRASDWIQAWRLCHALGVSLSTLLGYPTCDDNCAMKHERWKRVVCDDGEYYLCRTCGKFIGWIREKKN
ncbi:hypothetical protein [Roseiconus lacunae]|uniref:hypothetical protein n=1 Tax=Roseiconus lacunae TaxID=2605694 RepID=UPI00135B6AD2|nr:hypothetical protein [Roseiconus lacunae]